MRQILLFALLAASLALLSGCALSKAKADTAEDMTDKAAYPSTKSQSFSFIHVFYSSFSKSLGHSQEILRPCGRLRMKTYRTHSDTPFLRTTRFLRLRHLKTCNL